MITSSLLRIAGTASCLLASWNGWAGGHFDVDDAFTLDPGQCQYEAWWTRTKADASQTVHLGPACRVGPVELGLGFDRANFSGDRQNSIGPQVKWTAYKGDAAGAVSVALAAGITRDLTHQGKPGRQLLLPLSWQATDDVLVHINIGTDWSSTEGARTSRRGLAGEWAVADRVTLIAERNLAGGRWTSRVGARWAVTPLVSLDFSGALLGPAGIRSFVVGVNHEFSR